MVPARSWGSEVAGGSHLARMDDLVFYEILQMNTEKMRVPREGHEPDLCGVH